jgi:hypothetical protein
MLSAWKTENFYLFLDDPGSKNVPRHNEQMKKNRVIFRLFICAVCQVANQELPLQGHDEYSTSLNKLNFTEFPIVFLNYDPFLKKSHLNSATVI